MRRQAVVFLEVHTVEQLHELTVSAHGGASGVRDAGLLESAVMAPRSGYYATLAEMAAVYLHGIAKNHAFVDGNKRTAVIAAAAFLGANGYPLRLGAEWVEVVEGVANGAVSRESLVTHLVAAMGGDAIRVDDE